MFVHDSLISVIRLPKVNVEKHQEKIELVLHRTDSYHVGYISSSL